MIQWCCSSPHIIMLSSLLLTFPKGCFNIIVYLYPSSCNIKWTWRKYLIIRVFLPKTDVNYLDWIYLFKDESNGLFLSDKYCCCGSFSIFQKKCVFESSKLAVILTDCFTWKTFNFFLRYLNTQNFIIFERTIFISKHHVWWLSWNFSKPNRLFCKILSKSYLFSNSLD